MKLIVGLGNPGNQYENTRHNAGFIMLGEIQKELSFPEFEFSKKFNAEISEGNFNGQKIILAKPQTFMNLSGQSVSSLITFYKIPLEDLIVLHDDLDINLGAFKISTDSSAGGHNGVTSIFETLGSQKVRRIRIGIEGIEKKLERKMSGSDFVLQKFSQEEIEIIKKLLQEIIKNI
ncbi:MAG: Peptidyl-tRNA hydrolase [Parcubacteria group bacterium GW2011_GWD2_38_11]|nr:MAG: Peptidyl-tRNA hydrolase [Parcubacteria group bacterium GW2011_GWD2_38_11]